MKKIKRNLLTIILALGLIYVSQHINLENLNNTDLKEPIDTQESVFKDFTKAHVSRIIDGDTIEVVINSKKYKVRLIGVDSPEYTSKIEYYGKESTEYTNSILINQEIYLEKDVSETDRYGRLLRYVWLDIPLDYSIDEIKLKMFNGMLINNGYASQATYPPDIKYSNEFKKLSSIARENNKGLWKNE